MTKSDLLKLTSEGAGGITGKGTTLPEVDLTNATPSVGIYDVSKLETNTTDEQQKVKRPNYALYAGIAIVIGIVAFIIIKKYKK